MEKILVCIGRAPNTADLGLEALGVQVDKNGWVAANERMETSAEDVYAIGDILGPSRIMLAHVASAEGLVAAENALGGNREMDYAAVPSAIFTSPEVANAGLTEAQAKEQGYQARSDSVLFRTLGKAQVIGDIAGQAKTLSECGSGRVLGVHIIGPHATDLIAEGVLAIQHGAGVQDLAHTIHAHPPCQRSYWKRRIKPSTGLCTDRQPGGIRPSKGDSCRAKKWEVSASPGSSGGDGRGLH